MAEDSRLDPGNKMTGTRFIVIGLTWVAGGGGAATVATEHVLGKVVRVTTIPDGVLVPDPNYDVELLDADGMDVAAGGLANQLDTAPDGYVWPHACPVDSILTFSITNAGATRAGTLRLYVE